MSIEFFTTHFVRDVTTGLDYSTTYTIKDKALTDLLSKLSDSGRRPAVLVVDGDRVDIMCEKDRVH